MAFCVTIDSLLTQCGIIGTTMANRLMLLTLHDQCRIRVLLLDCGKSCTSAKIDAQEQNLAIYSFHIEFSDALHSTERHEKRTAYLRTIVAPTANS